MIVRTITSLIVTTALLIPATGCTRTSRGDTGAESTAQAHRSDAAIVTAVRAKFYTDDMLRGHDVGVSAADGVVTLKGDVSSISVRTRAVEVARSVEGVSRVEDRLTPGVPSVAETQPRGSRTRTEPSVRTRVLAAYFRAPTMKQSRVDVTTGSNGVVTLEGEVESPAARDLAEQVARGVEGVTDVDNRLHVRGDTRAAEPTRDAETGSDDAIKAQVQSRFFTHEATKAQDIGVQVVHGVVSLSGTVSDARTRREAIAVARSTDGVERVQDNLTVEENAPAGTTGTSILSSSLSRVGTGIADAWITTQVQASFFAEPDIKARNINVDTKAGVVTLTGEVGSANAKDEASAIAKEIDGVKKVVNRLTIASAT